MFRLTYAGLYLLLNGVRPIFIECDLDQNFQGQTIQVVILTSKCWENTNITVKVKLLKCLFCQVNAGKIQTLMLPSDRKSAICHRMAPI